MTWVLSSYVGEVRAVAAERAVCKEVFGSGGGARGHVSAGGDAEGADAHRGHAPGAALLKLYFS